MSRIDEIKTPSNSPLMGRIDTLVNELCPEGVEKVRLGDVCEILDNQRKPVSKSNRISGIYPYYGANGIQDYIDNYIFDGTYLLMGEDGSVINPDNSPILNWAEGKIWVNNHAHVLAEISSVALLRYLFYILQSTDVSDIVRGTPPKINQANLREIQIPLPPLSIQQEIVSVLDAFTTLIDKMKQEVEKRKKQMEYYREKLLTLEDGERTLSYYVFQPKERIDASELDKENYVSVENLLKDKAGKTVSESVPTEGNWIKYEIGDVLIGNIRPYLKKIWLADKPGGTNGDVVVLRSNKNSEIDCKYLYYVLSSDRFFAFYNNTAKGGKMPRGDKKKLMDYPVYFPPLEKQSSIVSTLDKFESYISKLERMIELRQKQYEYYREQLLTFE